MLYTKRNDRKPVINEIVFERFPVTPSEEIVKDSSAKTEPKKFLPEKIESENKKPSDKNLEEGKRLFNMKRWENALRELLTAKPDNADEEGKADLAYYLGLCYTKLKRYDDAVLYLEQVISGNKYPLRSYQCRMTLAYIYILKGKPKMAEFELKRLQNSDFESAALYNTMAYAAYAQLRYKDAVNLYEKALDIDKDNLTALNGMGFILVDTGLNREKGLALCRKVVDRNPKNAAYLDSLGWAHYRCGNFAEARMWLGKAVDIAPKEKEIRDHYRLATGGKL